MRSFNTPRDFAKDLIRAYVLRGDSYDSLKAGQLGQSWTGFSAHIGGYMWKKSDLEKEGTKPFKKLTNEQIGVEEFQGVEVMKVYSLKELFNEILNEKTAQQLAFI